VLTTLGPGESFGEAALLLNTLRTATVRARTPLRVLALDRSTFEQVVLLTGQEDSI
jgi:CRP-like cAMP-binding protein